VLAVTFSTAEIPLSTAPNAESSAWLVMMTSAPSEISDRDSTLVYAVTPD
jgi:hypothetical protein